MTHIKKIWQIIWNCLLKILRKRIPETVIIEEAVNNIIKEERRHEKWKRTIKKLKRYRDINQNILK